MPRSLLALVLALPLCAGDPEPLTLPPPATTEATAAARDLRQQVSYLIGIRIKQIIDEAVNEGDFDRAALLAGLRDAEAGTAVVPSVEEQQRLFAAYEQELAARKQAAAAGRQADNAAYLAEHGKQPGVITTASGLQYEVLKRGPEGGKRPSATSTVRVHYVGTKRDGTVFDSSRARGKPAEFPLNGVIKGWTEGLQLMREGDVFRFTIPSDLAYGAHAPPSIGPDQILIFEVELLKVLN